VRLAYYPNLMDGDGEMLEGLMRHYVATLPVQRARCRSWWKHDGIFFGETTYWWGSYRPTDYGCDREKEIDVENPFMWHHDEGVSSHAAKANYCASEKSWV